MGHLLERRSRRDGGRVRYTAVYHDLRDPIPAGNATDHIPTSTH